MTQSLRLGVRQAQRAVPQLAEALDIEFLAEFLLRAPLDQGASQGAQTRPRVVPVQRRAALLGLDHRVAYDDDAVLGQWNLLDAQREEIELAGVPLRTVEDHALIHAAAVRTHVVLRFRQQISQLEPLVLVDDLDAKHVEVRQRTRHHERGGRTQARPHRQIAVHQ